MISVQEAIKAARQFVVDLYSQEGTRLSDVLLEEVRREGRSWLITIGFRDPTADFVDNRGEFVDDGGNPAGVPTERGYIRWPRLYKVVRVDEGGQAVEMINRAA